jgi:hypothetical protein
VGYFDALTSSAFKTTEDGRRLFFPWGVLGRGYVLTEGQYEKLQKQVRIYMIVALILIIAMAVLKEYLATAVVVTFLIGFYLIWMKFVLPDLQPSEERLSLEESITSQAVRHHPVMLWFMTIASFAFVAMGVFVLIIDRASWWIGLGCIVFFGLCALMMTRMLVLRRQQAPR